MVVWAGEGGKVIVPKQSAETSLLLVLSVLDVARREPVYRRILIPAGYTSPSYLGYTYLWSPEQNRTPIPGLLPILSVLPVDSGTAGGGGGVEWIILVNGG